MKYFEVKVTQVGNNEWIATEIDDQHMDIYDDLNDLLSDLGMLLNVDIYDLHDKNTILPVEIENISGRVENEPPFLYGCIDPVNTDRVLYIGVDVRG